MYPMFCYNHTLLSFLQYSPFELFSYQIYSPHFIHTNRAVKLRQNKRGVPSITCRAWFVVDRQWHL